MSTERLRTREKRRDSATLQNVTAISTSNSRLRFGVRWRSGALDSASWIGEANQLSRGSANAKRQVRVES
jgi:hypothetical protein